MKDVRVKVTTRKDDRGKATNKKDVIGKVTTREDDRGNLTNKKDVRGKVRTREMIEERQQPGNLLREG